MNQIPICVCGNIRDAIRNLFAIRFIVERTQHVVVLLLATRTGQLRIHSGEISLRGTGKKMTAEAGRA